MRKACFIFNPRSGYNISNPQVIERARRFIAEQNAAGILDARLVSTESPHHATELARAAMNDGCSLIVAIGGDGTINETATALVNAPDPVVLGLIPCGSGNGLGRHLGIPKPNEHAFRTLLKGSPRLIDSARANDHPFFNMMGLGFDAEISAKFRSLTKRGLPAYLRIILSELRRYKVVPCAISSRESGVHVGRFDTTAFILAIGNSDQYGNNAFITPEARIDDGLLDLTLIPRATVWNALPIALRLMTRRLNSSRSVVHKRASGFVIERAAAGLIHTDGEPRETGAKIEVSILPKSLRVMVPTLGTPSS